MNYDDAYNDEFGDQVAARVRASGHVVCYSGSEWRQRRMLSGPPKLIDALFSPSLTVAPCARANLSRGPPMQRRATDRAERRRLVEKFGKRWKEEVGRCEWEIRGRPTGDA